MKTDELEKFVNENRDGFDEFTPDPAIWAQIQKNATKVKTFSIYKLMLRVAAVVVIFVSSYVFHDFRSENKQAAMLMQEADQNQLEEAKNFFEAKAYYASLIGHKEKEVFDLMKDYPDLKNELKDEFEEVDDELSELQKDLKDGAMNEVIIEAMIQKYRLKLSILEELLFALTADQNTQKTVEHEI